MHTFTIDYFCIVADGGSAVPVLAQQNSIAANQSGEFTDHFMGSG